jgi:hypothetical protein
MTTTANVLSYTQLNNQVDVVENEFINNYYQFFQIISRPYDFEEFIKKNINKSTESVFYYYFKFLLLDDKTKDYYYENLIKRVNSIERDTEPNREVKFDYLLKTIYFVGKELKSNELNLNEFFECQKEKECVKLFMNENFIYKKEKYITLQFFREFQQFVMKYNRLLLIYNFIDYYYDKFEQKIWRECNGDNFEDFMYKYEKTMRHFCKMEYLMRIDYKNNLKTYNYKIETYFNSSICENEEVMNCLVMEYFDKTIFNDNYITLEFKERYNYYLENVIHYDTQEDTYYLYKLIN